jgi:hypothetical protein
MPKASDMMASVPFLGPTDAGNGMARSRKGPAEGRTEAAEYQLSWVSGKAGRIWNSRNRSKYQKQDQSWRFHGCFLRAVSRRNWLYFIAIGGFLAVILHSQSVLAKDDNRKHQEEADRASYAIQQAGPKLGPIPFERKEPAKPDWANPECNKPKDHDEADLCVQRQMAHTARYSLYSNYFQIGLGVIGAGLLLWTLRYTRRATEATAVAANAARESANTLPVLERAYVIFTFECTAEEEKKGDVDIWRFTTVFQLENEGKTPAVIKEINFSVSVLENNNRFPDYKKSILDWDTIIKAGGIYPDQSANQLIPSPKTYIKMEEFPSNKIECDLSLEEARPILEGNKFMIILGRVVYADIFGIEWETGVCHTYDGKEKLSLNIGGMNIILVFENETARNRLYPQAAGRPF